MVVRATGINPAMLRWARERAGYSVEEVARRMRVPDERVESWEAGQICPTWKQAENLAQRLYRRSTTLFFLNDPPEEPTVYGEFPRLPASALDDLYPDTLYAVRQARARQHHLRVLAPREDASINQAMISLRNRAEPGDPHALVQLAQQHLERSPDVETHPKNGEVSVSYWRDWVEDAGVWVFLRNFKQEDIAGFCLWEYRFPVIYLNHAMPGPRLSATMLRQFAHLIFDFNHIENVDENYYLHLLSGDAVAIEKACSEFARQMVASSNQQENLRLPTAPRNSGPNYFAAAANRLGKKYLQAAFLAFDDERIDEVTLSSALGVNTEQICNLEAFAW